MQINLTSLSNVKINSRTNQGTSEGPETPVQEYLTRQMQLFQKLNQKYLGSPCRELANGGLGIVRAPTVFSGIFRVFLLGFHSSCTPFMNILGGSDVRHSRQFTAT